MTDLAEMRGWFIPSDGVRFRNDEIGCPPVCSTAIEAVR